ncbi:hypothetical protein YC2023_123213 [Brassica napus]
MAQDFIGRRNVNLFESFGQCGTSALRGNDAANERYLYMNLKPVARLNLFVRYDPIILLVLLNRAKCICSEYSTDIPRYNKQDVLPNLRHHLRGETIEHMVSWYGDVEGKIEKTKDVGERGECVYTTYGKV